MSPQRSPRVDKSVSHNGSLMLLSAGPPLGRPVVLVSGYPGDATAGTYLDHEVSVTQGLIDALLAVGRSVITCYSGTCLGTTTVVPDYGGEGRDVVDTAIAWADDLGFNTDTIDLIGLSHGGLVAVNWAWRNEALLHRMWLQAPAWDLSHVYDQDPTFESLGFGKISTRFHAVFGTDDKPSTLAACADVDPTRNLAGLAAIAERTAVVVAQDDGLIGIDALTADCTSLGIALTLIEGGGHFAPDWFPGWTDFAPAQWLA